MKFEHVLQIYWSKGVLYNSYLQRFTTSFKYMFRQPGGFSHPLRNFLIRRFELHTLQKDSDIPIINFGQYFPMSLNLFFSEFSSVNNTTQQLTQRQLVRLYLIKTTRGRSHALGKPCRGQRTWSNAWSAYNTNKVTRAFIGAYQKIEREKQKEEKINYRLIKKKSIRKEKKEVVAAIKTRATYWF